MPRSNIRAKLRRKHKAGQGATVHSVGWHRTAVYLTILITILTTVLVICLLISVLRGQYPRSRFANTTLLFKGNCDKSSRYNTWFHLAINVVSSGVLASSNFFMQVMTAPTRDDVDRAHRRSRSVEIGVQSMRNLISLPRRNVLFWTFFAVSSVPIHLVFNSCVVESRASTDSIMVLASEAFAKGAPWSLPGVGMTRYDMDGPRSVLRQTVADMSRELSRPSPGSPLWERIDLTECVRRYNDSRTPLVAFRNVVLVVRDTVNIGATGWVSNDILIDRGTDDFVRTNETNSVWYAQILKRTDGVINSLTAHPAQFGSLNAIMHLDLVTGDLVPRMSTFFREEYRTLKAQYCLS